MLFRKNRERIALIPNQWDGSVQHYYHFLLGYLAPIAIWLDKSNATQVTVRDCGPMNRWFECLPESVDIEIMNVGHFLHVFSGKLQPAVVLRGFDFPDEFNSKRLSRFRSVTLENLKIVLDNPKLVTVIDRVIEDPFYSTNESETEHAGSTRRSTPNLRGWALASRNEFDLTYRELTQLSIQEQVCLAANTRVLIGQHGAGLTNMVFMEPGGTVIEISPPVQSQAVEIFEKLAITCGHSYVRIRQESAHSHVDTTELSSVLRKFI